MRKTSLIDRELFRIFQDLIDSLLAFVPDDFADFASFIEVGSINAQPQLFYHIGDTEHPDKSLTEPDERIQRAAANLLEYFSRNGHEFPGFCITLQKQPGGTWKNDIQRLDSEAAASRFPSPIPRPLDR